MARFRFRLEASLRLAEQVLETAQRKLALEVQQWQRCVLACELQEQRLEEAFEGYREACWEKPGELAGWQIYVREQRNRLQQCQIERTEQEKVMEEARQSLLEAHRETEKFKRLKEKQEKAFWMAELQKEQKLLDETGQVLYWRQRN